MAETIDMARGLVRNLKERGGKGTIDLECDCGYFAEDVTIGDSEERVKQLLDHILFDHVSRHDLMIVRRASLLGGYELARMAGLDALTEHEVQWREANPQPPLALLRP